MAPAARSTAVEVDPRADATTEVPPATEPAPAPATRGLRLGSDPAAAALLERERDAESAALAETQVYARSYAVVIGVSDYDNLPDLPGARVDAERVARALAAQGFSVTTLRDEEATRARLVSELADRIPRVLGDNDRVLVYFAGHGHTSFDRRLGYLMPKDGRADAPAVTGISMDEVQQWLTRSYSAKHVLFVADACYSGLALRSRAVPATSTDPGYLRRITSDRLRFSLVAGSAEQVAHETDEGGVFTSFFLAGLEGAADRDDNGLVTSDELAGFVEDGVSSYVSRQWGVQQDPQAARLGAGEFVFFPGVHVAGAVPTGGQRDDASAGSTRPNYAGDIVRAQNALAAPEPTCANADLDRGLALVRGLQAFRVSFPRSTTQAQFTANVQALAATLRDGGERLQEAARLIRGAARSDPRCGPVFVEAYDLLARVAERYYEQVGALRPTLPSYVLRDVPAPQHPEMQRILTDALREQLAPVVRMGRCAAATSDVLGSRLARASVAATPAADAIAARLLRYRPAEVEMCLDELRDAQEGVAPFAPGETDPSCGHAIRPPPLTLTLPTVDELPGLTTPAAVSVYEDVRSLAASGREAAALVELRRLPSADTAPDLLVVAGMLALAMGDRAGATRSGRAALHGAPGHRSATLLMAAIDPDHEASWQAVRDVVSSAVRWDTTTRDALTLAGRMLLARQRGADALTVWELAAQHGQAIAAELAIGLSVRHGDGELATRLSSHVGADTPRTLVLRSQVACGAGDRDLAVGLARRALTSEPSFSVAHLAIAEAQGLAESQAPLEEERAALLAYRAARGRHFSARRDPQDAWAAQQTESNGPRLEQAAMVAAVLAQAAPGETSVTSTSTGTRVDRDVVASVIRANVEDVRYCYEDALRAQPDLAGRVTLRFVVGRRGDVAAAIVEHDEVGGGVGACIGAAARRWVFPGADAAVSVVYPFDLTTSERADGAVADGAASTAAAAAEAIARDAERCYAELIERQPWARGRVAVSVVFSAAGTILNVRVSGDRVGAELEPCMRAASARWTIPPGFAVAPGASPTAMQATRTFVVDLREGHPVSEPLAAPE